MDIVSVLCQKCIQMEKIVKQERARGYRRGYNAAVRDSRKAKDAKKRAQEKEFKRQLDIIDDVRQSKWA